MGLMPGPGDQFGPYRIEGPLGQGGMGVVLRATHLDLGRQVALKLLAPQLLGADDMVARFRREAQALARLDSSHVVQVYDAGAHDGWVYIATQLIPDGDLGELVQARGALPIPEALSLIDQVLRGLVDAHSVNLIHRDVKASNVLLRNESAGTRAFLCDFGIAQAVDLTGIEQTQGVIGTWSYVAPERFDGHPATVRADIYATGCLLWFLVTGQLPYEGTIAHLVLAHQTAPIPQLPATDPWSHAVNRVLLRSMAKRPEDRFASAEEMRTSLFPVVGPTPGQGMLRPASPVTVLAQPATVAGPARTQEDLPVRHGGPSAPPRGKRPAVILAISAVLIAVAAFAVVASGVLGGEESPDEPEADRRTSVSTTAPTAGTTKPVDATTVSTSPPPSETAPVPVEDGPRCWNAPGRVVGSLSECTSASGESGLFWAYPALTRVDPCRSDAGGTARSVLWKCNLRLSGGLPVDVTYSLWNKPALSAAYYQRESGRAGEVVEVDGKAAYYRWRYVDRATQLDKLAIVYIDHPFGVTVYVPKGNDPQRAVEEGIVRMRPPSGLRGTS